MNPPGSLRSIFSPTKENPLNCTSCPLKLPQCTDSNPISKEQYSHADQSLLRAPAEVPDMIRSENRHAGCPFPISGNTWFSFCTDIPSIIFHTWEECNHSWICPTWLTANATGHSSFHVKMSGPPCNRPTSTPSHTCKCGLMNGVRHQVVHKVQDHINETGSVDRFINHSAILSSLKHTTATKADSHSLIALIRITSALSPRRQQG